MSDFVPDPVEARELEKAMPPSRALSPGPSSVSSQLARAAVLGHFGAAKRVMSRQQVSSATGAGERDSARPAVDSRR